MSQQQEEADALLGKMLQKRLYVIFTTPLKPMSEMASILPEHLHYMIDLEKRGILFASGPFLAEDNETPGNGMTILRVDSRAEAETIAQDDPLYKNGMRTYEIKAWQLNEGGFTITLNYSDKSYHMS
jgi:uncharacterized protein